MLDLGPQQERLHALAREFAREEVAPVAAALDAEHRFGYDLIEKLGALGLMGVPYPEAYGGAGADTLSYALVIEQLGWADQSLALSVAAHTSLGTYPILAFGNEAQREAWLPQLCSGERLGSFGLTEPHAGSDAGNVATTARLEDGDWVIDGAKQFIGNSGTDISACVTITARTGKDEVSNIIVPRGTPGYEVGPAYRTIGWNAVDVHPLGFEGCRVPEANLLGPRGDGLSQFLATLDGGRIGIAALALGCAQRCLDEAIAYAKERTAFGQAIGSVQLIQAKL
ncbi:MAG: acyl-CoA dehydrogenase family protein, partial [Actinomycetota bacterium]|nr:acyl-CoA dehydrogenase family protein [Actinomycetota bacterium]